MGKGGGCGGCGFKPGNRGAELLVGEVAIAFTNWLAGRLGTASVQAEDFEVQSLVGGKLAKNQPSLLWIRH